MIEFEYNHRDILKSLIQNLERIDKMTSMSNKL